MKSDATMWQKSVQTEIILKHSLFMGFLVIDYHVLNLNNKIIRYLCIVIIDRTFHWSSLSFYLVRLTVFFFSPFASGRPDGVYNKSCRHEKSPSKSSEVISPEILKMRAALFCIFTYLDTKTLLRTAEVCRDWKFVARHPAVWTRVLLENARISSKVCGRTEVWHATASFSAKWKFLHLLFPSVPQHPVPVVHSDAFTHPAEPQAQTARKEGKQGRLCEKHTVGEKQDNVCPIWVFFFSFLKASE